MELETGTYTGVYERLYHLSESLHYAYAPGVFGTFRYDFQDSPPQVLWDIPRAPHALYDVQ